jgi:hypothetical protein
MLDVGQNMRNLQSAFEPIQADIANRFASVDGARSSGFGEALGRGFAQSITPMALGQQSTALSQLPAYAAAPLALGSQAGGELFRAGGLERQIGLEGLEDQYRRTEAQQPWMNPWLQMGMGTLGVSPFDSVVSQRFSPAAAASAMLTSPGVLNFLGQGLQGGAPGQAGMASPNQGGLFGSGMRFGF